MDKKCLFGCFWARIKDKLLSHLKSAPLDLSNCKLSSNNEMPKFLTKVPYLGIFGLDF